MSHPRAARTPISEKSPVLGTPEQEWLWHQLLHLQEEAQLMKMPLAIDYGLDDSGNLAFLVTVKEDRE